MDFYRSREECVQLRGSKATSDFARRTNIPFDCLNSKRPQDVQYNEAEHIATLKENIEWLDRWHTYNQSLPKQKQLFFLSKPTCNALRMTLHSTVTLVEKLLKCGFRYVLVGNIGQDNLEMDTLAVLFDDILLEPAECMQDMIHPESTKDCILDYLGGYVPNKYAKISCKDCLQTLRSNSQEPTALTVIKTRGFSQVPSEQLLRLLQIVEEDVEMRNIGNISYANVYMKIVENILLYDRNSSASVGCGTHFVSTTAEVVHFFIKCRLHFFTREQNKLFRAGGRPSCPVRGERKPGTKIFFSDLFCDIHSISQLFIHSFIHADLHKLYVPVLMAVWNF
ncbi:uncharacterized protein LOC142783809 [Rhipicephalus microplus]|uniref:uncharacterized protein LOC142783809 n=1 Tax=Rhipicephalus microplus TaxID=6941 RepID=UPI003F6D2046